MTLENRAQGFALAETAVAAGFRLRDFETVGSTNDAALDLAAGGASANRTWIVARAQTKGRGRHGRQWQSPPGNLYASLLLIDEVTPRAAPQLGFVAGVALAHALRRLSPDGTRIRLKWPNDILLDDAKLAGILAEGRALVQGYAPSSALASIANPARRICLTGRRPLSTRARRGTGQRMFSFCSRKK